MSEPINGNTPAFPRRFHQQRLDNGAIFTDDGALGLSKRELFAAMAMQGMISNPDIDILKPSEYASDALLYADALVAALANPPTK